MMALIRGQGLPALEHRRHKAFAAHAERVFFSHVERQRVLEPREDGPKAISQVVQARALFVEVGGIDCRCDVLGEQFLDSTQALIDLTGAFQPEPACQADVR
jgi:hypothetical protein